METNLWWTLSKEEVVDRLRTDPKDGLSQSEVNERLQKYGRNQFPVKKRVSPLKLLINQFTSMIIWLLIAAIIIAAALGELIDAIAIAVIVLLNGILGFFQEYRAERSLEALQKLAYPTSRVIRDGTFATIPAAELVPGDVVLLENGDAIAADGRLIESTLLATQEAILTGESMPLDKIVDPLPSQDLLLGDRKSMVYMGTTVVRGKGKMIVCSTGLATELGKIASLLQTEKDEQTPLQVRLNTLGRRLTWMCLVIVAIVFLSGLWRGSPWMNSLLIAVSLAVAAIPEGLPAVVTIALSLGVRKMAEQHALIRRLPSVETLGCTTVICTDKTGTLTENEMSVRYIWTDKLLFSVTGAGYTPIGIFELNKQKINPQEFESLRLTLQICVLCNNSALFQDKETVQWKVMGDPTEVALLVAAKKANIDKAEEEEKYPLKEEIPFDSERKIMSMLREKDHEQILFVKGALDVVLNISTKIWLNNEENPLTDELKQEILKINGELASQALRILGFAFRSIHDHVQTLEAELTFVGFAAMLDPPRPEVKDAIEMCKKAGIQIVMITGDHQNTAVAIAEELKLMKPEMLAINGKDLEKMDAETLKKEVRNIVIYARTSAELKLKIVQAWKSIGEIVAMTGDGVNDAPAIKEADIGLAMGQKGTDVSREASDMIILDDNFATIVNAVREGRGIYDNIIKFVSYLISCNIAELLIIFASIVFNFRDPDGYPFFALTALQLLWLNLVTDGLPAIALSMDPVDPNAMNRPPRSPSEPILNKRLSLHLFTISCVIAAGTLIACLYGLQHSKHLSYTMTFTILVVLELVRVQMVRSQYNMKLFSNPLIIVALVSSLVLQLMVVYVPFFQKIFETVPLGWIEWLILIAIAAAVFLVSKVVNRLFRISK